MPMIVLLYIHRTRIYTCQLFYDHWAVLMLGRHFLTVLEVNPCYPTPSSLDFCCQAACIENHYFSAGTSSSLSVLKIYYSIWHLQMKSYHACPIYIAVAMNPWSLVTVRHCKSGVCTNQLCRPMEWSLFWTVTILLQVAMSDLFNLRKDIVQGETVTWVWLFLNRRGGEGLACYTRLFVVDTDYFLLPYTVWKQPVSWCIRVTWSSFTATVLMGPSGAIC